MKKTCIKNFIMYALLMLVASCSSVKNDVSASSESIAQSLAEDRKARDDLSLKPQDNELNSHKNKAGIAAQERFDMSISNMPAKDFFIGLVSDSGMNVVTHPDVDGNISLDLKSVTIDEVLAVTRDVYGYEFKKTRNIYSIYPRTLRTEIFEVNYLDVSRKGKTNSSVLIGSITSSSGNSNSGGQDNSVGNNSSQFVSSGSEVETTNETDFWNDLTRTISAIVKRTGEGESVVVNPQAGVVVVTALPREINSVRRYLTRTEQNIARQVILEAKIVEVKLSDSYQAGVNWDQIQGQVLLSNNVTSFQSPAEIISTSQDAGEIFSSIFSVPDISNLISLLETQGNVQVLSSPRVSTVNNQKALIRVGSDEFFVTGISNQTTTSAAATSTTPDIELTSFFSGISLDVTPQIAKDGEVILHVHPIVSNVTDQNKEIRIGDDEFSLPLALREVRESDSIVKARSGQVIVLGGLMKERVVDTEGKRPGLGDIPGLNLFFKSRQDVKEKTELVILLRPIVVNDHSYQEDLDNTYRRINALPDEI